MKNNFYRINFLERITYAEVDVQEVFLSAVEKFTEFEFVKNKFLRVGVVNFCSEIKSQNKKRQVVTNTESGSDRNFFKKRVCFKFLRFLALRYLAQIPYIADVNEQGVINVTEKFGQMSAPFQIPFNQ